MFAEQAIFTSLVRRGRSGYHLVARSPGVNDAEAVSLATWAPSHGGLIVDEANRVSVNFHPLPGGRFALTRTREGRAEPSGRGGRQVYTHALVIDAAALRQSRFQPFALYRDAMALGHFHYRADPEPVLKPVRLSTLHRGRGEPASAPDAPAIEEVLGRLEAGEPVVLSHRGDRAELAERLLARLSTDAVSRLSFATSLRPSTVHPYRLGLVPDV